MKVCVALLCVALVGVASGSPAISWLTNISNTVNESISKATNLASEKGKEGLAKIQELIAQLEQQIAKAQADLQVAKTQAQQTAQEYILKALNDQIEKLKKVEEKLSGWMGKN